MDDLTLSIVIPSYNRAAILRDTLLALARQTYSARRFEVVVAVDGSTDGTVAMLSRISLPYRLRFTSDEQAGTAAARNRGLAMAEGEVVVSLDDDIVAHPDLLSAHAALHRRRAGAVGLGRLALWPGTRLDRFGRYWYRRFDEHYDKLAGSDYTPEFVDCLSGNLSLRRDDVLAAGAFDVRFRAYNHEDVELGYRLARRGLTFVYLPAALGYHRCEKSFAQGCWDAYGDGRSSVILARKHPEVIGRLRMSLRRKVPLPVALLRRALTRRLPSTRSLISGTDALRPLLEAALRPGLARLYYAAICDACYWRGVRDQLSAEPVAPRAGARP